MLRALHTLLILNILCICTYATDSCEKPKWFKCKNKNCISFPFVCDGEDDCGDNSDELDCIGFTLAPPTTCLKNEFQCLDKICIPNDWVCDGKQNCLDGTDETVGCINRCDSFLCHDLCIPKEWICDGTNDCEDNSDERDCSSNYLNVSAQICSNVNDSYLCKNEKCITLSKVCDHKDDCGDNSDENTVGCANAEALCSKNKLGCSHLCRRTPYGPICSCPNGYNLLNNRTCLDKNECEIYGKCDQRCENLEGSFKCTCQDGYELQDDQRTCKANGGEAVMIISTKTEIRELYLDAMQYVPIVRDLQHVVGVSRDSVYIYWSNVQLGDEAIVKQLEFGSKQEVIATAGLGTPEEIAVDWVTGNVYFTDSLLKHIGVCTNNGSACTVIISESANKPRGIALLPSAGQMYWSDWGKAAHISKAGMDGKDNIPFITENIHWPNGIAIDYPNERLYWVEAKLKIIESIDLNGSDRRTVLQEELKHPYSIAVFENKLYWSDWVTHSVQSCNKFSGKDQQLLIKEKGIIFGIHIYHSVLQPKIPNPCKHGFCSHMCLLAVNKSYSCACPLDMELGSDQHTCKASMKQKHIIIAAGNMFIDYYHAILGKPKMTGSLTIRHVMDLAYDSLSGTVFGSDRLTNSIFRFDPKTGKAVTLLFVRNESIGGMDFDYLGNNLYWCNTYHKTIEIYSLNTKERSVLEFTEVPSNIVLIPNYGIMYVVFQSENKVHIDKLRMTGLGPRTRVVESNILGPKVSFTYDRELEKIYWADEGTGRIESTSVEGDDRRLLLTGLHAPVSLAVLDREVFWTTRKSKRLYWTDKNNIIEGNKKITLNVANDLEIMHLVTLSGIYAGTEHMCSQNNAGCSHICLVVTPKLHMCSCPPGLSLNSDQSTCNTQTTCRSDEIKCTADNICIDEHKRCNGIKDCSDGEDEVNCEQSVSCSSAEFTCKNGQCINSSKRCDNVDDCDDKSDERNCNADHQITINNTDPIHCEEYRCTTGTCLPYSNVCNGKPDCFDNSDEGGECESSCNTINPCEKICRKTPSGPVCSCPVGYRLRNDGHSCEDINECDDSVCSQNCHNYPGSFSCSCFDGYTLYSDMVSCKIDGPPMVIIGTTKDDIKKMSPSLNSVEVIHHQPNVTGLDVNAKRNTIYWSCESTGMINKMSLNTKEMKVITNVGRPRVLAVDWVTDNVYLYDIEHSPTIKVCNLEKEKCAKIVYIKETANVTAIAVDPIHGWLFWSQTNWSVLNNPTSEIYRTDMIGLNLTVIAFQSLGTVSGITVDYMRSHLYWADNHLQVIEKSDLNGANRQVFLKAPVYRPMGLNLYDNSLYWVSANTGKLKSCSLYLTLYGNKICHMIEISSAHIDKFVVLQISRQPFVKNDCQDHKCDYMCVLRNGKSACICPNGNLIEANVTCSENSNMKSKFKSNTSEIKHTQENGAVTGIIITAVTAIVIISAYCYYQRKKLGTFDKHDLSIYFQNTLYDRRHEVTIVEPVLSPGEHAYANPLVDLPQNHKQEGKDVRRIIELIPSDHSENEVEDTSCSQKSRLLQ